MSSKCIGHLTSAICLMAALLLSNACTNYSSTTPAPPSCPHPNPLVSKRNNGFAVTTDSLPGTVVVTILTFDAQGNPLDSVNVPPKSEKPFLYGPSATRPIQLRFFYKSADGSIIGQDELRVDDPETNNGGVIAMDVVMGLTAPNTTPALSNAPDCPTVSTNATGAVGSITFSCASNDWFQVKLIHNNVEQRIGLYVTTDSPNKLGIYRSNVYSCLTIPDVAVDEEDGKSAEVDVSSSANVAAIAASINNDNGQKTITIVGPAGCLISVNKK